MHLQRYALYSIYHVAHLNETRYTGSAQVRGRHGHLRGAQSAHRRRAVGGGMEQSAAREFANSVASRVCLCACKQTAARLAHGGGVCARIVSSAALAACCTAQVCRV